MNTAKAVGLLLGFCGLGLPLAAQSVPPSPDHLNGAQAAAESVGDLPLSENPAPSGSTLAVLLSGDGGWAAGDKSVAKAFVSQSVAVVGLNSPRYLEDHKPTPDQAAGDLARILRHFLSTWGRQRVIVVGYSRGADIGPFMVARLPEDLRKHVAMLVLLGPGDAASFKFSVLDVLHSHQGNGLPVAPEVAKLRGIPVLCIYGEKDRGASCQSLEQAGLARSLMRDGGHKVHGDEGPALVESILAQLRVPPHSRG